MRSVGARKKLESREGHPSKVNLRATGRRTKGSHLEYVRSMARDEELAARLEKVLEKRSLIRLRTSRSYPLVCFDTPFLVDLVRRSPQAEEKLPQSPPQKPRDCEAEGIPEGSAGQKRGRRGS